MNSIYYVGGYISHSVIKRLKCSSCSQIVKENDAFPVHSFQVQDDSSKYFDIMNRGGLSKPSENTLEICTLCFRIFYRICKDNESKSIFLAAVNHLMLFKKLDSNSLCYIPIVTVCEDNHDFSKFIITAMFHIMCKNFVKENSCRDDNTRKLSKFNN